MRNIAIIFLSLILVTACSKKKKITPDIVVEEQIPAPVTEVVNEPIPETTEITSVDIVEIPTEIIEVEAIESDLAKEEVLAIEEVVDTKPEIKEQMVPQQDSDHIYPDSIWVDYMIKPGDYLSLIAYQEYGNANEWRRIWKWNQEHWEENGIGPDSDNPNLIYPYNELDLKKPTANAVEWEYEHYFYSVKPHDSLWTIAKEVYGDEFAWVVLFWDNDALINANDGKLMPEMKLKIRSQLWPEFD